VDLHRRENKKISPAEIRYNVHSWKKSARNERVMGRCLCCVSKTIQRMPTELGVRNLHRSWMANLIFVQVAILCCDTVKVGGSSVLRNAGILPHHYTVSQPGKARFESSSLENIKSGMNLVPSVPY
jgi:hypothetical protein